MNCAEARRHLTFFADDELSSPLREQVAAHVADCPSCAHVIRDWREFRESAARKHMGITVPAGLADRVATALQPARVTHSGSRPAAGRWRVLVAGLAAAASFGVMVTVAYRTFWVPEDGRESINDGLPTISPVVLASVHQRCANETQHNILHKAGADTRREAAQLCAARKFDVVLPDLDALGYELAGICECPKNEKSAIVHAYYRSKNDAALFVSVFSFEKKMRLEGCGHAGACGKKEERVYDEFVDSAKNLTCLKWDEGRCSYAICSEQFRETLQTIADQIQVKPTAESKKK